ncbi:hypothetical protein [Clostridium kluyveri]|uniref:Phage-related protein n=2 Tax=Clostridium kluyveri TaxID=1534 RepID=A5N2E7_CLOK5|nr:hypothetical protein [Clostridium kluyveri]EDK35293.1 Phage-related protein [Clostridium kluyveri DSM 555]BAH07958.1 hypothetical protein CKR_2907 [Clostridium kluyveri NBRC 12016]
MSYKEKCFEYFSSNKEQGKEDLLKGAVSKFGITRLTAENYYSKWEEEKDVEEAVENIFGKDETNELCENTKFEKETAAVNNKPAKPADKSAKDCEGPAKDSKKRLKIVRLEGEKLSFSIEGKYVTLYTPQSKSIDVKIEDLKDIIAEIQEFMELKEVVM